MAEMFFPFASVNGDRMIGVETYERMLGAIFTQGVFPRGEMLAVTSTESMEVQVNTGSAIIVRTGEKASLYHNTSPVTLNIEVADAVAERIDTIVLRRDNTARNISLVISSGMPASTPVAAELVRNDDMWDIALAHVRVRAGAAEILQSDIVDLRNDPEMCGIVSSIAEIDSGMFFYQQQAIFDEWFANLNATLDENVAGNLANQIYDLQIHTNGATCEVVNRAVTIAASDWAENAETFRIEAKVLDENIHTYSNVRLTLRNEDAGKYAISMEPRPSEGYVVLFPTGSAPTVDIEMQLLVEEVRLVEQKS